MNFQDFDTSKNNLFDVYAESIYYYESSTGPVAQDILIVPELGGGSIILKPGQSYNFNKSNTRFLVTPRNAGQVVRGVLQFFDGRLDDNRLSGDVNMIDNSRARTLSRQAFAFAGGSLGQGAGIFSACQLFNPNGSGKNIFITRLELLSPGAVGILLAGFDTQLNSSGGVIGSKLLDGSGAASVCVARYHNAFNVSNPGGMGATLFVSGGNAGVTYAMTLKEPICIAPSRGLMMIASVANQQINYNVELFEDSV